MFSLSVNERRTKTLEERRINISNEFILQTSFWKVHSSTPEIIQLSKLIGRTSGSVAYKLVNLASLDPSLHTRGIKGATNASKLDKEIWNEFYLHWDVLPYESEKLLASFKQTTVEILNDIVEEELPKVGKVREAIVKIRVKQSFFRKSVLAAYNCTCCITGLQNPEFLIAGHIRPWGLDEANRLNPRNGIAINSLHDKAFETGLLTITPEYRIKISSILKKQNKIQSVNDYFLIMKIKKLFYPPNFYQIQNF